MRATTAALSLALLASSGWGFAQTADSSQTSAAPEPTPTVAVQPPPIFGPEQQDFRSNLHDVTFDLNQSQPNNPDVLRADAQWLQAHPNVRFYVFGDADWRGDIVYNLVLSQRRAQTVRDLLVQQGISADRIVLPVGWGKLLPTCAEQTEACFAQNRRTYFVYIPQGWQPSNTPTSSTGR